MARIRLLPDDELNDDTRAQLVAPPEEKNRFATVEFYVWQVAELVAAFLFGLALFWLVPTLRGSPLSWFARRSVR